MNKIFSGLCPVESADKQPSGGFVTYDNEPYYEIKNPDAMQAFFISLASDSDLWLYIASNGSLSAGRKNPDTALFPYYTDDKITDGAPFTGSKTILLVRKDEKTFLWEPLSDNYRGMYRTERSIAKSVTGNKLLFRETNFDLGITFCYNWTGTDRFGFIKKSEIINLSADAIELSIIDGLQNILPAGVNRAAQNEYSTLVDGYKKTELISESTLALFRMEALLVDRAEPGESLLANTVWSTGIEKADILLSTAQLQNFRQGKDIFPESESKGVRGAYLLHTKLKLTGNEKSKWYFAADLQQDAVKIVDLLHYLKGSAKQMQDIEAAIEAGTETLKSLVSKADGLQQTADQHNTSRHFANVLFNLMRGGIYNDEYRIESAAFMHHVGHFNSKIATKNNAFLQSLPEFIDYHALEEAVVQQKDAQLYRLYQEYLPLTFSRRHGDPSRPWNQFNIRVNDEKGHKLISYQGNWRDIFQNWEALSLSYPGYINGIIAKFLNASTIDGYNPYKLTSEGIDWEVIEPENPWSNIGYWGDHQIIYLQKLLETADKHFPEALKSLVTAGLFAYANVPYRIKSYAEIVENPKNTILFDHTLHQQILDQEKTYGADARLVRNPDGDVRLVSFTEKILVSLLAKLTNLVPGAGIWMNTLRPEWNDANNALVGYGASMVTLYYMRRMVVFLQQLYQKTDVETLTVSASVNNLFADSNAILTQFSEKTKTGFSDADRRDFTDKSGMAAENFRNAAYGQQHTETTTISKKSLLDFLTAALQHIDHSIEKGRREDGLYHAYNLISFNKNGIAIRELSEMLEGQVAVLSSGKPDAGEVADLLDSLRISKLYRANQNSYMLYPDKKLPLFLEKNSFEKNKIAGITLLQKMHETGDNSVIAEDAAGKLHFNAAFSNGGILKDILLKINQKGTYKISEEEIDQTCALYESVFDHQSFTGRSGTFYKYEGLGSIYWHMVSKLLLAVGENTEKAIDNQADETDVERLKKHYAAIKAGIGAHKKPEEYGSFPFDPYSHTPIMAGVQQPGMTGQVKEDILNRFMELGVKIVEGRIRFNPFLLDKSEFLPADENNLYAWLTFTLCSVPVIYQQDEETGIDLIYEDGRTEKLTGYEIPEETSKLIFLKNSGIEAIFVHFAQNLF